MKHKKQTPWLLIIVGIACLGATLWYFTGERHSTMDKMQHPAANLPDESPITKKEITVCEVIDAAQLEVITKDTRPAVIKFYAPWCGACNHVASYYTDIAQECGEAVDFYSVNIDTPGLAEKADALGLSKEKIQYLPTFVFIQSGKVHEQKVGALSKEELVSQIKTLFPA